MPSATTMTGASPVLATCAATASATRPRQCLPGCGRDVVSSHSGDEPAYTIWSGISGPASTSARPSGVPATQAASADPSNATVRATPSTPSAPPTTRESRSTARGRTRRCCGRRRPTCRDPRAHRGDDLLGALDDRRLIVAGDDQTVVLEQRHLDRTPGRPARVAPPRDLPGQGQPGVRVRDPQDRVAEQVAGECLPIPCAGQCVDGGGMGVDHEPPRDERMEHALHRRSPGALVTQACGHRDAHHRVAAGLGLACGLDQVQQRPHLERHQRFGRHRGQRDAAGLDEQRSPVLDRAVATAGAGVLRIRAEASRQAGARLAEVRRGCGRVHDHRRP